MHRPDLVAAVRGVSAGVFALVSLAASAQTYPVSAELRLAPRDAQHCLEGERQADCAVVDITRDAFASAFARLFRRSDKPDLIFTLRVRRAEIARVAGLQLDLDVDVLVESPAGDRIDELHATAFANVLTLEEGPIRSAERTAAEQAVQDFERSYQTDAAVSDYLVNKHVGPAAAVGVVRRNRHHWLVAVGPGVSTGGGEDDAAFAPAARISFAYDWFFLQAMVAHWSPGFRAIAQRQTVAASLDTLDLGLEAGALIRLVPTIDLRIGAGIHALSGSGSFDTVAGPSSSFSEGAPSIYASVSKSFLFGRSGVGMVVGLEGRVLFSSDVDLPELQRTIGVGNFFVGAFIGIELPFGSNTDKG